MWLVYPHEVFVIMPPRVCPKSLVWEQRTIKRGVCHGNKYIAVNYCEKHPKMRVQGKFQ